MPGIFTQYEAGLEQLLGRLGKEHPRYAETLTLQSRLLENIAQARQYGDTDALKNTRAQIVDRLNRLTLQIVGVSFNELCKSPGLHAPIECTQGVTIVDSARTESSLLSQIRRIVAPYFPLLVAICAAAGAVTGGFLWNMLNVLLDWTFFLGGSGSEPHGFQAFIWGAVSAFPVISFALLACYKYIPLNRESFGKVPAVISLYTVFGGIGAVIFYDSGFRNYVEAAKLGYGSQEIIIVVVWAAIISTATFLPLLMLNRIFRNILDARRLLLQILLSVIFSFLAVLVSLSVKKPIEEIEQLRGFFAVIALRLGLFMGIVLSISLKPQKSG